MSGANLSTFGRPEMKSFAMCRTSRQLTASLSCSPLLQTGNLKLTIAESTCMFTPFCLYNFQLITKDKRIIRACTHWTIWDVFLANFLLLRWRLIRAKTLGFFFCTAEETMARSLSWRGQPYRKASTSLEKDIQRASVKKLLSQVDKWREKKSHFV